MTTHHKNYTEEELGYPTEAHGRIPSFANREEEAAFWDTHNITEFVGEELQSVEVTIGPELSNRLTIRLDTADRVELARRARAKGVGPSTLARMWLKERLRQEAEANAR
jgi:CopG antitoxin of type II toxin-antitoxin system